MIQTISSRGMKSARVAAIALVFGLPLAACGDNPVGISDEAALTGGADASPNLQSDVRADCASPMPLRTYETIVVTTGNCVLAPGTVVTGNVQQSGGSLEADSVIIKGQVQARAGVSTVLENSVVESGVVIDKTTGQVSIVHNYIKGNLQIAQKPSGDITITDNFFDGNLEIQAKMAAAGGLVVSSNTIKGNMHEQQTTFLTNVISDNITDGNLRCQRNDVPPEVNGRPNGVKGEAGGQCAELVFEDGFITHKLLLKIDGADGLHMTVNAVGKFKVEDGNVNVNVNVDVATSH